MKRVVDDRVVSTFGEFQRSARGPILEEHFPKEFFNYVLEDSIPPRFGLLNTQAGIRIALEGLRDYKNEWPDEFENCEAMLEAYLDPCVFHEGSYGGSTFKCYDDGSMSISPTNVLTSDGSAYECGRTVIERAIESTRRNTGGRGTATLEKLSILAEHYGIPLK